MAAPTGQERLCGECWWLCEGGCLVPVSARWTRRPRTALARFFCQAGSSTSTRMVHKMAEARLASPTRQVQIARKKESWTGSFYHEPPRACSI